MATAVGTYATLSDLKLRLQDSDTSDDTLLQKLCDQANMWIETKTGRILAPVSTFSTTVSSGFGAGTATGVVASATGLNVNDVLMFGPVSGTHESAAVTAVNGTTVTLATNLVNSYAASTAVKRVSIFDGFDAYGNGKVLLVPLGLAGAVNSLEVATFSAGQGGATVANVIWYTIPASDYFTRPTPQEREPGFPATELWITNVPIPGDITPAFYPGYNNVRVDAALGWPAIPDDIVECALNIAVALYRGRGSTGGDIVHVGTDGQQVINRSLTYEDRLTISRYSRHDFRVI